MEPESPRPANRDLSPEVREALDELHLLILASEERKFRLMRVLFQDIGNRITVLIERRRERGQPDYCGSCPTE